MVLGHFYCTVVKLGCLSYNLGRHTHSSRGRW